MSGTPPCSIREKGAPVLRPSTSQPRLTQGDPVARGRPRREWYFGTDGLSRSGAFEMLTFDRQSILQRLTERIATGRAILGAGCSAGIIARSADEAGADLIVVYSTGRSRLMGLPTWRMGDAIADTLRMASEILNVVSATPVVGGVEANDPTRRNLRHVLDMYQDAGFSGVINFPTLTNMPDQRRRAEMVGYGFEREVELIRMAAEDGMFTMAYVASREDAVAMAEVGVDCIVSHSGPTRGGSLGYADDRTVEQISAEADDILLAAAGVRPGVISLLHGGGLATPEDVATALSITSAVGFVGASSIERIPVERAVKETVASFRAISISSTPHDSGGSQ